MKLIDLTHMISPEMPVYPGTEPPVVIAGCRIDDCGFEEKKITLFSHTGTHMDAPAHMIKGAATLDQLPITAFCGEALMLDCRATGHPEIGIERLARHGEEMAQVQFLVLHTGWSRHWGSDRYFSDFPVLTSEAADWLSRFRLKGIGVDAISVDRVESGDYANHLHLLRNDTLIIENLTRLDAVPIRRFLFSAFPLKFQNADGAPVRAVAAVEEY